MEQSLKLGLIEQYVEHQEILHILPHARFSYLLLTLKYGVVIIALGLLRPVLGQIGESLHLVIGVVGIALFAKYVYDFLDKYMDTVILTNKGITIVRIDSWLKYKVDSFDWGSIIAISHSQGGIMDKLFNEGAIQISLDQDNDYSIEGVASPGKQSSIINKLRFDLMAQAKEIELQNDEPDKFEILVDTLSEVIGTYMKTNPR